VKITDMPQGVKPRSLVCKSCWTSIFSTYKFRTLCKPVEAYQYNGLTYITTHRHVEKAAAAGCTWCNIILAEVISNDYVDYTQGDFAPSLPPGELQIELVSFCSGSRRNNYTPAGHNRALIFVNGWPLQPEVFTTEDSTVGEIVTARNLDNQVNSVRASRQIHAWLIECDQHEKCGPLQPSLLPTRVIEVSPEEHPECPRLYEAKGAWVTMLLFLTAGEQTKRVLRHCTMSIPDFNG
jgi:hypothetical protein